MSFAGFRDQIGAIAHDLGGRYWKAVADDASTLLHKVMRDRREGVYQDALLFWTYATDEDFAAAAAELKAMYSETTGERLIAHGTQGPARILHRVSAVWIEGKKYRRRLVRIWSYQQYDGDDLKWAAEVTEFGRRSIGGPIYMSETERKRYQKDARSEHLAEQMLKHLFENNFRIELDPA